MQLNLFGCELLLFVARKESYSASRTTETRLVARGRDCLLPATSHGARHDKRVGGSNQ